MLNSANWTRFYKVSPGGNTTILLDAAQVPPELRAELSAKLMGSLSLGAEQVGFIDWPHAAGNQGKKFISTSLPRLDMMGGELCANALRSYAAVLALELGQALPWQGKIASSGVDGPVNVYVTGDDEGVDAAIEVPLGEECRITALAPEKEGGASRGAVVELPGITHIVLPGNLDYENSSLEMDRDLIRSAETWRRTLGLSENKAVGCIWYYLKKGGLSMQPLVWVRDTNSNCFETSCGSGAIALALFWGEVCGQESCGSASNPTGGGVYSPPYTSYTNFYRIMQPSGQPLWISYNSAPSACPGSIWLGGPCEIIARGETRT